MKNKEKSTIAIYPEIEESKEICEGIEYDCFRTYLKVQHNAYLRFINAYLRFIQLINPPIIWPKDAVPPKKGTPEYIENKEENKNILIKNVEHFNKYGRKKEPSILKFCVDKNGTAIER